MILRHQLISYVKSSSLNDNLCHIAISDRNIIMNAVITNLPNYSTNHHKEGYYDNEPTKMNEELEVKGSYSMWKFFISKPDFTEPVPLRSIQPQEWSTPGIRFWWIGHATCLIQLGTKFVLTDPVFSNSASPVSFMIKRTTPLPISIDDLPPISYVLLSHDHYDHLDYSSIISLTKRFPDMVILTGLDLAEYVQEWGCKSVAFDWRQRMCIDNIVFTCMPARHWTNRKGYDKARRLWCSFLIEHEGVSIYFPGDTAVGEHFEEIRKLVGKPIDLVPMPIGPKCPEKIMRPVHLDGRQAAMMSKVLEAKRSVPIHWGIFPLGAKFDKTDLQEFIETASEIEYSSCIRKLKVGGLLEWNGQEFECPSADSILDMEK